MAVIRKVRSVFRIIAFLFRNIFFSFKMRPFEELEFDTFTMEPLRRKNVNVIFEVYKQLNDGNELSLEKRLLLWIIGKKFCYVLRSKDGTIFGMGLYYFNKRDIIEKTIHEGYVGLKTRYRGLGIGTQARKCALEHFAKFHFLNGVSSRVSLDNLPSLKGNIKLGFEVKEQYWDDNMKNERVYLVCSLDRYR